jgi:small subunit ribosomal protein S10
MKANIWEYEDLEAATRAGYETKEGDYSRRREGAVMRKVDEILNSRGFKEGMEGHEKSKVEMRP